MENVNNRSLFRNRSGAARDKVRQMGMVREPQGILSSFPELMNAAGRNRPQNGMMQQPMMQPPMMQPQMMRMPQGMQQQPMMQPQRMEMSPMMQSPMMQQQPPTRFQDGGAVEPSFMERVGQNAMLATGMSMPTQRFDIAATPTPRARVEVPDISTLVKQQIGDNPEAQARLPSSRARSPIRKPPTSSAKKRSPALRASRTAKTACVPVVSQITDGSSLSRQPLTS